MNSVLYEYVVLIFAVLLTLLLPFEVRVLAAKVPLNKFGLPMIPFNASLIRNGQLYTSDLDDILPTWVRVRHILYSLSQQRKAEVYAQLNRMGKLQKPIPEDQPFPCNLNVTPPRSATPPDSVHRLRPGDIDIIASMGDSLMAGNGIISTTPLSVVNEYRSMVFSTGGRGSWREYLTLANILRVFNPQLYGQATTDGLSVDRNSVFNVAETASLSRDMPFMAGVLIKRLQRDPRVDMERHWKMLTIFVGNNDVCTDACNYDSLDDVLRNHERDLRATLTLLRDNVPRLFINLMPGIDPTNYSHKMENKTRSCAQSHMISCTCLFRVGITANELTRWTRFIRKFQQVDERVAALPEFRTDDFVVNYEGFLRRPFLPRLANGSTDFRFAAADCFHFSQMGHAVTANSLWNNMFRNVSFSYKLFEHFECPTAERPYLVTWSNDGGRG